MDESNQPEDAPEPDPPSASSSRKRIVGLAILLSVVLALLMLRSCTGDDDDVIVGYLATTEEEIAFLQWTKDGARLTGTAQTAEISRSTPGGVKQESGQMTGLVRDDRLTLTFTQFGFSVTWNGEINGDKLVLSHPPEDGVTETTFQRADMKDYQEALAELRQKAAVQPTPSRP